MELKCNALFDCFKAISICFLLSVTYVGSLYIWKTPYNRDHPDVVKKRFLSVLIMFFISPLFLYVGIEESLYDRTSLWSLLGLRIEGLFQATILPLLLTMILFLGPLVMQAYSSGYPKFQPEPVSWISSLTNVLVLRNFLVAPLSEEFTFRSCMMPILLQYFEPMTVVLTVPLFFGIAHFHHMHERMKMGLTLKIALQISCLQFAFTTLFGVYSAFLFLRTGHFVSIFMVHAFCNCMGFPNFEDIFNFKGIKKIIIIIMFLLGATLWCYLLYPITKPSLYSNHSPWNITLS